MILTQQSSKGLEFPRVIVVGLGKLKAEPENVGRESRQLYVAMTRARQCLLVTASEANVHTRKIEAILPRPPHLDRHSVAASLSRTRDQPRYRSRRRHRIPARRPMRQGQHPETASKPAT